MNIDVKISFSDNNFVYKQKSNLVVRKMITFIIIRSLNTIQHKILKYVVLLCYIFEIDKNGKSVTTFIEKEFHLIKNLKVNMLINNNIIILKSIVIDTQKQQTNIRSCNVIASLKIKFKAVYALQRSIHVKKIVVLSSRVQLIVVVHNFFDNLFIDRDFFFEFDDIEFTFYVHLVDFFIKVILVTNNTNQLVKISRNFRLKKLIKLNYSHIFQI